MIAVLELITLKLSFSCLTRHMNSLLIIDADTDRYVNILVIRSQSVTNSVMSALTRGRYKKIWMIYRKAATLPQSTKLEVWYRIPAALLTVSVSVNNFLECPTLQSLSGYASMTAFAIKICKNVLIFMSNINTNVGWCGYIPDFTTPLSNVL